MRNNGLKILAALFIAISSVIGYCTNVEENPVTGEKQHVNITVEQEIALGLQSAPQMAQQHGGLSTDEKAQQLVKTVGQKLVAGTAASKSPYKFDFHLLADPNTVNAFALPGGQIFITEALLSRLTSEDQLAGILGHEIGHVIERHSAEHIAKARLTQGLTGAAVIASYDPSNPASMKSAAVAALIGNLVNMKYGRDDELESDKYGVKFMFDTGYKPEAMIEVMEILAKASGGSRQPEFASTHPNPENRIARIQELIAEYRGGAQ